MTRHSALRDDTSWSPLPSRPRPPAASLGPRSGFLPKFRGRKRRGRPAGLSREDGGSEAGRERSRFPAGAEWGGLQTCCGQVHHERVRPSRAPLAFLCGSLSPPSPPLPPLFSGSQFSCRLNALECPVVTTAQAAAGIRPRLLERGSQMCIGGLPGGHRSHSGGSRRL